MANRKPVSQPQPEVANAMQGHIQRVACTKTIYVSDVEQWGEWALYAQEQGISMSELINAALTAYVEKECPRCKRIAAILATGSVKVDKAKK